MKDFKAIKQKDEKAQPLSRGLGPNIGSEEWNTAQKKLKASKDYAKDLREMNRNKYHHQAIKMESMMAGGFGAKKFIAQKAEGTSVKDRMRDY